MIALFLAFVSAALAVNVNFCGVLRVNYSDVTSQLSQLEDDYIVDNSNRAARGALIVVTDNNDGSVHNIRLADGDPACSSTGPIALDANHTYSLKLLADAYLNANSVVVMNNDTDDAVWAYHGPTAWTPVAGDKTLTTGSHEAWNIFAAATWAIHRRNAGLALVDFNFYTQTCPYLSGASCYDNGELYIDAEDYDEKYVIVHEMGHKVARERDENGAPGTPDLTPDGICTSVDGAFVQKRYVGKAANEGIAWYWAAMAFNDTSEANCEIARAADFNQDGVALAADNEQSPSCEGDPIQESWADLDYMGSTCGGTLEDRGTYLDWMRAFWDADHGQGLSTERIFDLWDEANPKNWDATGGGLTNNDDPQERLEAAAASPALGISTEWNNVDNVNGVR